MLPAGLSIDRSYGPVPHHIDPGLRWGCAISRTALPVPIVNPLKWWSSDFVCGYSQNPEDYTIHYGPFDTELEARQNIDGNLLTLMDQHGTDGVSAWLTLP